MRIIYTNHAEKKFHLLEELGWKLSKRKVTSTVSRPRWRGRSRLGQYSAMSRLDRGYILRVIYDRIGGSVKIITFHPAREGRYETQI